MSALEKYILESGYNDVLPALNYIRFIYFIPLITSVETYNPRRWLELDRPDTEIKLMFRTRLSVWLVRHRMFALNKMLQIAVRKLFGK